MLNREIFSSRLFGLLEKTNTSQQALATAIDISRQSITQYCSQVKQPNVDKLIQIADYFDVSTDYLLGRSDSPERML